MTVSSPTRGRKNLTVGLLWHSLRSGNLGVGALTLANMAIARAEAERLGADIRFVIFGMRDNGGTAEQASGVETRIIDRRFLLSRNGFRQALDDIDCMLDIGAGDSFADIYGARRFFFLWYSKIVTARAKVPLILSPQTIGPFTRFPYRQLARYALHRSTAVVSRDDLSLEIMKSLAPRARSLFAVDVAFLLPFESRANERGGKTIKVGVNASGLLFHQAETGRNAFGLSYDYAAYIRALLAKLTARDDVKVHLIAHATSGTDAGDDDGTLADRLATEFSGVVRVPNFPGPCEAKSTISGLDFLIAARMHACVAAFSAGTPVLPVAYSRKFQGLFGSLGYDWSLPVQGLTVDEAVARTFSAIDGRDDLARNESAGMARVEERMEPYRALLRESFDSILAGRQ
ncbi:MAG: polysaccharide pyruvyl transferase family protein [Sphingobium sp.]